MANAFEMTYPSFVEAVVIWMYLDFEYSSRASFFHSLALVLQRYKRKYCSLRQVLVGYITTVRAAKNWYEDSPLRSQKFICIHALFETYRCNVRMFPTSELVGTWGTFCTSMLL